MSFVLYAIIERIHTPFERNITHLSINAFERAKYDT